MGGCRGGLEVNMQIFKTKQKLEHIRWRAIANPHAVKEI